MTRDSSRGPADTPLEPVRRTLAARDATAFVHAGPATEPSIRYLLSTSDTVSGPSGPAPSDAGTVDVHAVAVTPEDVIACEPDGGTHPAVRLAESLADVGPGPLLAPASIPHDAALYVEEAGFTLASSDALATARAHKTEAERDRLEAAQVAASAGLRRAATLLEGASIRDGRLVVDDDPLTPDRFRRAVDAAVVTADAFPDGRTRVYTPDGDTDAIRAGEPVVCHLAPRGPGGYHGGLVRTLVVEGDGGWTRRAHVAIEGAFRSIAAMLRGEETTVAALEAELVAEIRSFGFGEEATATVHGVGLESRERPVAPADPVEDGEVVRVEAAVTATDATTEVRLADLLERRDGDVGWLSNPPRSLVPATVVEATEAGFE